MVRTESLLLVIAAMIAPEIMTTQDVAIGTENLAATVVPVTIYSRWTPIAGNTGQFSFNLRGIRDISTVLDQFSWPIITNIVSTTPNAVIRDDPNRFIAVTWSNKLTGVEGNSGIAPVEAVCVP